ncbi:MAG: hypothetical protein AAFQ43_01665 [Bacteroidota bacterium]
MTRDALARWLIATVVGLGLSLLAPEVSDDPSFFASGACVTDAPASGAPLASGAIPVRLVTSCTSDQRRGVLQHYVVPGKVSEDAADAARLRALPVPD